MKEGWDKELKYITELTDLGYLKIVDSSVNEKQVTLYVKA
jgi:hypothetical protein